MIIDERVRGEYQGARQGAHGCGMYKLQLPHGPVNSQDNFYKAIVLYANSCPDCAVPSSSLPPAATTNRKPVRCAPCARVACAPVCPVCVPRVCVPVPPGVFEPVPWIPRGRLVPYIVIVDPAKQSANSRSLKTLVLLLVWAFVRPPQYFGRDRTAPKSAFRSRKRFSAFTATRK